MKLVYSTLLALTFSFIELSYGQKELQFGSSFLFDNNIYRNYARKGDMVSIPYANLSYGIAHGDFDKIFLGYEGEFYLFRELSHRNFSVHDFGLDYNHLWPESQNILALGGRVETRVNPEDYKYYNYTSGGLYLNYKNYLREYVVLNAGYNLNAKMFSEFSEFNNLENIFALQTSISLPTRTTIQLNATYYLKDYTSNIASLDSVYIPPLNNPQDMPGMGNSQGSGHGSGQGMGQGYAWGRGYRRAVTDSLSGSDLGSYVYRRVLDQFPSTDQVRLGISLSQNLVEKTGLMLGYTVRMNPHKRNRFLADLGESVLNNEELFDDHYSYLGHEGTVQLKQILPARSVLTVLLTARQRKFSGRPAMDLEGFFLPSGESRLDRALLFEADFTKKFSIGKNPVFKDIELSIQFGAGKNNSNDAYYDYDNAYFLCSLEKAF